MPPHPNPTPISPHLIPPDQIPSDLVRSRRTTWSFIASSSGESSYAVVKSSKNEFTAAGLEVTMRDTRPRRTSRMKPSTTALNSLAHSSHPSKMTTRVPQSQAWRARQRCVLLAPSFFCSTPRRTCHRWGPMPVSQHRSNWSRSVQLKAASIVGAARAHVASAVCVNWCHRCGCRSSLLSFSHVGSNPTVVTFPGGYWGSPARCFCRWRTNSTT